MPNAVFFIALFFALGLAMPAYAEGEQDHPHYNYKKAPQDPQAEKEHEQNEAEDTRENNEDEMTELQRQEYEQRKLTGDQSDIFHGDENKWPHSGKWH